jgi:hypothetical protein
MEYIFLKFRNLFQITGFMDPVLLSEYLITGSTKFRKLGLFPTSGEERGGKERGRAR